MLSFFQNLFYYYYYHLKIIFIKNIILYQLNFQELYVIFLNDLLCEPSKKTDINIPYIKKISRNTILEMNDLNDLEEVLLLIKEKNENNYLKNEIKKLEFEIARNSNNNNNKCLLTLKEGFIIYHDDNYNNPQIYKYHNHKFYNKNYGIMNICKNKNRNELIYTLNLLKNFYDVYQNLIYNNDNKSITISTLNNIINNLN